MKKIWIMLLDAIAMVGMVKLRQQGVAVDDYD